jgi:hypothetical protein
MSAPPWWNDVRTPIAFLAAPFAVPLIVALSVPAPDSRDTAAAAAAVSVSALVSYLGTFIFGVPTYLFLRARQLTAFWFAPVAGFIAGTTMWYLFFVLFGLSLGSSSIGSAILDPSLLSSALGRIGPLGALVGTILWLIARPDRARR